MKYYEITYPNHTTLILKTTQDLADVLYSFQMFDGINSPSGEIYNPKMFISLRYILSPTNTQQLVAQTYKKFFIGADGQR